MENESPAPKGQRGFCISDPREKPMLGSFRRGAIAMAAFLSLGMSCGPAFTAQPSVQLNAARNTRRSLFGTAQAPLTAWTYRGAGTTMAQQKRAAAKKRGVARNRHNHR